ncbi:MAG TPA: helix-turn-helix domain-containing protein [Bacillota bacterium]|nr:helix-turn-helix domain-containing protein [Bacillota bacterium]
MVKDLRAICLSNGQTREENAKLAGISRSTYVYIENGQHPSLRLALGIAKVLKPKLVDIFLLDGVN